MARVVSVNLSPEKGTPKTPVAQAELVAGHGLKGDAHAGPWHRQVSLLAVESVDAMRATCAVPLPCGVFGENLDVQGFSLAALPVGARLRVGPCLLEVTQLGKECHHDCAIRQQVGHCVMPTEGVFARVLEGGAVRPGDELRLEAANRAEP